MGSLCSLRRWVPRLWWSKATGVRSKPPPLHAMKPQQPVRVVLDNGIVLLLQQDKELPLMTMNVMIRGGVKDEPFDKTGLSDIFAESWRSAGPSRAPATKSTIFGAACGADRDRQRSHANDADHALPEKDFADVLGLAVELLREPEFRQDKIEIAKRQVYTAISRRNDESSEIAGRESTKLAYGKDHPLARQEEYATIAGITRDDLLFVAPSVCPLRQPDRRHLGRFRSRRAVGAVQAEAGDASAEPESDAAGALALSRRGQGFTLCPSARVNQSSIHLVQLGTTRKTRITTRSR